MTLATEGPISLSDVRSEIGGGSFPISLGDSRVRLMAGKPTGEISMSDLYGKTYDIVPVNLGEALAAPTGWNYSEELGWYRDTYGLDVSYPSRFRPEFLAQVRKVSCEFSGYFNVPGQSLYSNSLELRTNKRTVIIGLYDGNSDANFYHWKYDENQRYQITHDVIGEVYSYTSEEDEVLQELYFRSGGYTSSYAIGRRGMRNLVFYGPATEPFETFYPNTVDFLMALSIASGFTYEEGLGWFKNTYTWNSTVQFHPDKAGLLLEDIRRISADFTSYYNTPSGGMGQSMLRVITNKRDLLMGTSDGSTAPGPGQSVNDPDGVSANLGDVVNRRIGMTLLPGEVITSIYVLSNGYTDGITYYPFGKRGIDNLEFDSNKEIVVDAISMYALNYTGTGFNAYGFSRSGGQGDVIPSTWQGALINYLNVTHYLSEGTYTFGFTLNSFNLPAVDKVFGITIGGVFIKNLTKTKGDGTSNYAWIGATLTQAQFVAIANAINGNILPVKIHRYL